MSKFTKVGYGIMLLLISGLANAGAESGFYIGGSTGSASIDISSNSVKFDDSDTGYKIFAGYNFGLIPLVDVAVEGSYVDFGKASSSDIGNKDIGIKAWDLFGVGGLSFGPFGLFAKLGMVDWDSSSDVVQNELDKSGNDTAYGLGARFQLGSIAIRAEYEVFEIEVADIAFASIGAAWTF